MTTENSQQESMSDYDKEWALEDDSPENSTVDANDNQPTAEGDTSSEAAGDASSDTSPKESTPSSEESNGVEDIWAGATEAQRQAFASAENERLAASNRAKINADRLSERGRELSSLRTERDELALAARVPTEFETEHEQYGKDIEEMIQRRISEALPPVVEEEKSVAEVEQEVFDVITTAHPTAGAMYNSPELQAMLADNPVIKHDGRAVLFSDLMHDEDPNKVVAALDHFTTNAPAAAPSGLDAMTTVAGQQTSHDMRTSANLTTKEQYDREWENED